MSSARRFPALRCRVSHILVISGSKESRNHFFPLAWTSPFYRVFAPAPTPCSRSSLSHAHRSMGFFRNQTFVLPAADSTRPIDYCVSDSRVEFTPTPTPSSCPSLSHTHSSMGFFRNQTFALPATGSVRPIDYSVSDSRVSFAPAPTPCSHSSLSSGHRSMVFFGNQTFDLEVTDSPKLSLFLIRSRRPTPFLAPSLVLFPPCSA